jgi:hypothetical protein
MIAEGTGAGDEPFVLPISLDKFNLFYDRALDSEDATPYLGLCRAVLPVGSNFGRPAT